MGAAVFWGSLLILLGIILVIKVVFNVDFPVIKVLVAAFFVFLGIRILFGSFGMFQIKTGPNDVLFSERHYHAPFDQPEYNVVFGKGVFDFTNVDLSEGSKNVKIGTVFAGTVIKISKDMPVEIAADAVFAGAELPGGNTAVFGSATYVTDNYQSDSTHLRIKLDVVFGGVQVIQE